MVTVLARSIYSPCCLPPLHGLTEAGFPPCLLICLHRLLFRTFFASLVHVSFVCVLLSVLLWSAHCWCSAVSHCQVCSMCLLLSRSQFRAPFSLSRDQTGLLDPLFFLPWDLRAILAFAHTSGVRTLFFCSSMTNFAFAHTSRLSADVDDDIQVYPPRSSSISVDSNWSPPFYKAKSNYFCSGTFAWKKRWDLLGAGIREGM